MKPVVLEQATLDQLLSDYQQAAVTHRNASRNGDYRKANPAHARLAVAFRELRTRGPEAHEAFLTLLTDERVEVRGWAAADALEFNPERATSVLTQIASGPQTLEELSARMVLQQWQAGTLVFP